MVYFVLVLIGRRDFIGQLGLLGLFSVLEPKTIEARGGIAGARIHEALFKKQAREFVENELKIPFEKAIGDLASCPEDKFLQSMFSLANKLPALLMKRFPGRISHENIKTQVQSVYDANTYCYTMIEKKFGKNAHSIVAKYDHAYNFDIELGLHYSGTNNYCSLEDYKRFLSTDSINLFHPLPEHSTKVNIDELSLGDFKELFQELFPGMKLPETVSYKEVTDKSFNSLGRYCYGEIYISQPKIKDYCDRTGNPYPVELNGTLVNELFHLTLNKELGVDDSDWRKQNLYRGRNFGTSYSVKNNKEIEEVISDICTMSVNKRNLLDMLTNRYEFSSALAHKTLYDVFPGLAKTVRADEWKNFTFKQIEDWFKQELERNGVKNPKLEEEIYEPAFRELRKWAIERMKDIRKS